MASWLEAKTLALTLALAVGVRAEPTFYQARVAPILDQHCTACHGATKQKAKLRVDSLEALLRGGEAGEVIKPGDLKGSELVRRINLPETDDEVMPSDGKPHLSRDEIKVIELWIAGGASATKVLGDFPGAPIASRPKPAALAWTADWQPRAAEIAAIEQATGLKLVSRSQVATDGLILRTASAPSRCNDAALEKIAPVAGLIVEAELARTKVTDAGLKVLARCENLRAVDLTRTAVTSDGVAVLAGLKKLEVVNLTGTAVDDAGVAQLKSVASLKQLWLFGTKAGVP
ncbi:MAG TPA: c-type cytochrome domain-containing protein [Opitutaceae bacterium]|nr:c-type cytochrome domain-containing protein [Opitutaceae bacterium]